MRVVKAEIQIRKPALDVFNAFIEPDQLRGWWGVEKTEIEPRKGGHYALAWFISEAGIRYLNAGTIKIWQPGRRLLIENWAWYSPDRPFMVGMTKEIRLEKRRKNTLLTVEQSGYGDGPDWDWYYEAVLEAWPRVLADLKNHLEKPA